MHEASTDLEVNIASYWVVEEFQLNEAVWTHWGPMVLQSLCPGEGRGTTRDGFEWIHGEVNGRPKLALNRLANYRKKAGSSHKQDPLDRAQGNQFLGQGLLAQFDRPLDEGLRD